MVKHTHEQKLARLRNRILNFFKETSGWDEERAIGHVIYSITSDSDSSGWHQCKMGLDGKIRFRFQRDITVDLKKFKEIIKQFKYQEMVRNNSFRVEINNLSKKYGGRDKKQTIRNHQTEEYGKFR